jgi:hypothetical protein
MVFKKGNKVWLGKKHSKETKKKMSESKKRMFIGDNNPFYGKHHSEESRNKISKSRKGLTKGENNPMYGKTGELCPSWKGGISFENYPKEFNDLLKESIRQRDNYTCQECNLTQEQLVYTLHIHHIDYNKRNNLPSNLITLCNSCHSQTNFGRDDWTNYYTQKVMKCV